MAALEHVAWYGDPEVYDLRADPDGVPVPPGPVTVTSELLEELRQRHVASDLLVLLKHTLGDGEQVTLALQS